MTTEAMAVVWLALQTEEDVLHVNLGWAVVDVRTKMLNMLNIWLIIYRGKIYSGFFVAS